jgi:uncharacterized protein (DUF488 family)
VDTALFTIGHSTHEWEFFLTLLRQAGVSALADVRSSPYSAFSPQFSSAELQAALRLAGLSYVFMGKELGGRPIDPRCYSDGIADYEKMAVSVIFRDGVERVIEGSRRHRIALMCSERDPLDCHRFLLVSRRLAERGLSPAHILANGQVSTHREIEDRLLELTDRMADDLFAPRAERLALAYRERARKVAYSEALNKSGADYR